MGKTLDGYRRLFDGIKKGKVHNLYFLYGPEEYLKKEFIRDLLEAVLPEASERAFNLDILYGDEFDRAMFDDRLGTFPMFTQKRVVILRNFRALGSAARDHVIEAAEKLSESMVFVVETADERLDTARLKKMKKVASERGLAVPFGYLDDQETVERVMGRFRREGLQIAPDALDLLIESVGTHLIDLGNEMEKILLAAGDAKTVDRELVGRVVGRYRTENLFSFLDQLARARAADLVTRLNSLIDGGEEPVFILSMMLRRTVLLMEVLAIIEERGRSVSSGRALADHMAGATSPFYAEVLRRQAQGIKSEEMEILLSNLRWADLKIKSTAIPPRTLIEEAILASQSGQQLRMTA